MSEKFIFTEEKAEFFGFVFSHAHIRLPFTFTFFLATWDLETRNGLYSLLSGKKFLTNIILTGWKIGDRKTRAINALAENKGQVLYFSFEMFESFPFFFQGIPTESRRREEKSLPKSWLLANWDKYAPHGSPMQHTYIYPICESGKTMLPMISFLWLDHSCQILIRCSHEFGLNGRPANRI